MKRYLNILTVIFTLVLLAWSIVEIIQKGMALWTFAILLYLVFVSLTLWFSRSDPSKNLSSTSPSSNQESSKPAPDNQPGVRNSPQKTAQEIILETIRARGKAKRHDFLPKVGLSKSSLGRLLDQMESKGLIVQTGERKGSFYTLPKANPD